MIKRTLLTILILVVTAVYGQMNSYEMELVHTFVAGDYSAQYIEPFSSAHDSSPSAYYFDTDGNIYVGDWTFKRIVKYDKNFNFIEDYKKLKSSRYSRIVVKNNLVFASDLEYLLLESLDGEILFSYERNKEINKKAFNKFFNYDNGVVTFSTMDGSVYRVANPSNVPEENVIEKVTENVTSRSIGTPGFETYASFLKYKETMVPKEAETRTLGDPTKSLNSITLRSPKTMKYLGTDSDGNIYWNDSYKHIIIFNSNNQFIDAFSFDVPNSQIDPVVHPNGDVYFMDITDERAELLKVNRVW